ATTNPNYDKLQAGYLFPEIAKRTRAFLAGNPGASVMRLGIGDTTEPLTPSVIAGLHRGVDKLADVKSYTGYGAEQGNADLREALAKRYASIGVAIEDDEVFVSDGAKPDSANIQSIFGPDNVVAVQDPAYPVYVDSNVIAGRTGQWKDGRFEGLVYMPCNESNGFFPDVPKGKVDLIYICSPNNPTGAVATKAQLEAFVDYARAHQAVIVFDSAYAAYISDPALPRSIFEIDGARECAIELSSFSKEAGFTGVRLGWTVVPKSVVCEGAEAGKVHRLWNRRQTTMFNGASNIVQEGGVAVLSEAGQRECAQMVAYYMNNARTIKAGLERVGLTVFGGVNAPYVWLQCPNNMKSWDFFDKLLTETHVVGTPGAGFGPSGEGYFRLSSFGHAEDIARAVASIEKNLQL
ncbi:MAG: LL-diaminopimelate aminotransferase, partial [Candidatus Hydrogenedentes bacterium]|nr:LL-diaminopimelate aminotransferase [Candidatus Hydrogenedentota bacterium]